jgi:hypothetical protein
MSETPYSPAEQPGDDDWTSHAPGGQPRYSASASVPPAAPAFGQPPAPQSFGQPQQGYGQPQAPQSFGQPPAAPAFGQPPAGNYGQPAPAFGQPANSFGQPPASGAGPAGPGGAGGPAAGGPAGQASVGSARVAGSASIPNYGPAPQGYPAQPSQAGVYGNQAGNAPGGPAGGGPAGGGQYGSAAPATYGSAPATFGQPPAQPFGQPGSGGPGGPGGPAFGGPGFGGPNPNANLGGGHFGQPNQGHGGPPPGFNPPSYPQNYQGEPDRGREQNWSDEDSGSTGGRRPKRGLIIALIAVVLLVVVGIGGFVGYKLTNRSTDFAVGTCVLKDDNSAKVVDCTTGGAYKITSLEDAVSKCPDIFQPSLALPSAPAEHRYACLAPAAAE